MPRFPMLDQLRLPALFVRSVPGKLHPDGRRYLPLLIFRLSDRSEIGVVDRHHLIPAEQAGQSGSVAIVLLLSTIRLQPAPGGRYGVIAEHGGSEHVSTSPTMYGQVVAVPSWEEERGNLSYEALYTELLLDIGTGIVGVRTTATADDLVAALGKARIEPGDWLSVEHSRIDVLAFVPSPTPDPEH